MSGMPTPIEPGYYDGLIVYPFDAAHFIDLKLQVLDIFCVAGDSILSKGIRFVTSNQNSDRESEFNHSGIMSGGSCTLECLLTLTNENLFHRYQGCKILIGRWNKINYELTLKALKETNKHIGQWYPIYRIPLHLINVAHLFHWRKLVCSEYVAKVLYKAGARHANFFGTNPDHIADEIRCALNKERTGPKYSILFDGYLPYLYYGLCWDCKAIYPIPFFRKSRTIAKAPTCPKHPNVILRSIPAGLIYKYPILKEVITYEKKLTEFAQKKDGHVYV